MQQKHCKSIMPNKYQSSGKQVDSDTVTQNRYDIRIYSSFKETSAVYIIMWCLILLPSVHNTKFCGVL